MKENSLSRYVKFAWLIFTIFATLISVYVLFFPEKVKLSYEIISDTSLLEIDKDVSNLSVLYSGVNLKETNSNLRILTILVQNKGGKALSKDLYDENELPGLQIDNGRVVEMPRIINTSNDYLKKWLSLTVESSSSSIRFSPIILEPGDFFTIKVVYLFTNGENQEIESVGKIAGMKSINVIRRDNPETNTFWIDVFTGGLMIQFTRLFLYTLFGVAILITLIYIMSITDDFRLKLKRKRNIKEFKRINRCNGNDEVIFTTYVNEGPWIISTMKMILKNEKNLKKEILEHKLFSESSKNKPLKVLGGLYNTSVKKILEIKLANLDKTDNLIINQPLKNTLFGLSNFLDKKDPHNRSEVVFNHHVASLDQVQIQNQLSTK